jgi:predicted transcriptional regulator
MMKYRSRTDIVGLILEATNGGGATKTKIMYKSFVSFAQLKEYLMVLLENDLIEYEEGEKTYRTTPKGMRLLQMFNNMEELNPIRLKEIRENSIHV